MPKTVLFIGAGKFQAEGIRKAKEMGLRTIAVDRDPNAPGFKFADVSHNVDVTDIATCLEIAKKYKIDGVLTISSEVALPTVAAIAEELGLPGVTRKVAEISRDKELQRKCFKEHGVPSPASYPAFSFEDVEKAAREIGFPLVLKPADNAGARGVTRVDRWADLKKSFELAKKYSRSGKILVEQFMEGPPLSVEAFVYSGKPHILAFSDKDKTPPPYLVDTLVVFPSKYQEMKNKRLLSKIKLVAKKAIGAIGAENGPIHIEMIMTEEGPKMIELGARGPGFKVFTDILPYVTGIDVVKETIKLAIGEKPDLKVKKKRSAVLLFFQNTPGVLKKVIGIEAARKIRGIHEIEIYVKPGDMIRPLTCGDDRIGHIIAFGKGRNSTIKTAREAERKIKFMVEKKCDET